MPHTWLQSVWANYYGLIPLDNPADPACNLIFHQFIERNWNDNFVNFINNYLSDDPGFVTWYFNRFINEQSLVGRKENLGEDLCSILTELKIRHRSLRALKTVERFGIQKMYETFGCIWRGSS
tara:strand:- start:78 stop:446 length:369 start_codon:yes stop_codon:yes gene_type:complete